MSVYKPSNFFPLLQEIDITKDNEFSCQVNTSGESIQAYKIQILSGSGEDIVAESQCINTTVPIKNKSFLKISGVSNKLDSDLINGKDYQWGVRTYNVKKGSTKQPNTVVCNGFLVGSTRYVIWAKNNTEIIEDRYLEIETTGPDQIFDIIGTNEEGITKPADGEVYRERHKIEWITKDLGANKNMTKIELDDSFKYNYKDGTAFKIFKCSDAHGLNNVYIEPNDEIKSSNYIIIYNTAEEAKSASAAGDTPEKTTITPRETGRKIIGYSVDTGEIRVQESFKQVPVNGNAYLLFEYNTSTKTYTEKKFTDVSNIIGGVEVTSTEDAFTIITNKITDDGYQLFIQPNINIRTDETNPNELVFENGTRLDIIKTTGIVNGKVVDTTIDKLDNTQWLLTTCTNANNGEVPIIPKSNYTVYTDFMDSAPFCIFYARQEPDLHIMYKNTNIVESKFVPIVNQDGTTTTRGYRDITFYTEWHTNDSNISDYDNYYDGVLSTADDYSDYYPNAKNDNDIKVKYYQYTLYDADGYQIAQSEKMYDSELTWNYRGFESGPQEYIPNRYTISIMIVDEYGKEYSKSSKFNIYYDSTVGIVPLDVEFVCEDNAMRVVASSPTYVATTDYTYGDGTTKATVDFGDVDNAEDYLKIPDGEILNYTTVIDGKEPPTPIIIPRTFSFVSQFQITGDFVDKIVPDINNVPTELEVMQIGYKTSKPEDEEQTYSSLILKMNSLTTYYMTTDENGAEVIKRNDDIFNLKLYKEGNSTPLQCFVKGYNKEDHYNIQLSDDYQEFKAPTVLRYALQSDSEYWVYDGGEYLEMPTGLPDGYQYLVLTNRVKGGTSQNIVYYNPGIYTYDKGTRSWSAYTDTEYIYVDNLSQLPEEFGDYDSFGTPENCRDTDISTGNLMWEDTGNVWIDSQNYFAEINKAALNKKWFMLYLIVKANEDGTEDISCEIQINQKRI